MAVSYIVDEEALIFLNEKVELVAFFDLTEVDSIQVASSGLGWKICGYTSALGLNLLE